MSLWIKESSDWQSTECRQKQCAHNTMPIHIYFISKEYKKVII